MNSHLVHLYKTRAALAVYFWILAVIALAAGTARAHSFPTAETPSAGQTLAAPPATVSIKFDAPIEHRSASLEVVGQDGANRAAGLPVISADRRTMAVKVGALAPGVYTVRWAATGRDTHHTNGSYIFTVKGTGTR
ncbi:MAG TPA: copper resistance protein CopC [Candidatus Binataceae bacterium]|nr:copper resistance protein CopC [Candidatus Binataceae bacterium]